MKNKKGILSLLSLFLLIALITATACFTASCDKNGTDAESGEPASESESVTKTTSKTDTEASAETELGEGSTVFSFAVKTGDGTTYSYKISTNSETVGDALDALGLIGYDVGAYGRYVKSVLGESHDYNVDGKYWAFYINGSYAMTGIDSTTVENGAEYMLSVE